MRIATLLDRMLPETMDSPALRDVIGSMERGRMPRMVAALSTAFVISMWLGPIYPLCWVALIAVRELLLVPMIIERFALPNLETAPRKAEIALTLSTLIGALSYVAGWLPAWIAGDESATFLAAIWFAGTLVHGFVYFSNMRRLLIASTGPAVVAALVTPFLIATPASAGVIVFGVVLLLVQVGVAGKDRGALIASNTAADTARQEAEAANIAKSQFLATMSHELRTPLNAVIGYAEILEEDLAAGGKTESAADAARIRRAARNLLSMINEVLDLSKIEAGRMEMLITETDVASIIRDAVETCSHIAAENRDIVSVEIDPEIGVLMTDGPRLRQCVLNLVSNACKFTTDGRIDIRAGLESINGVDRLRIDVADTGCGISPEYAEKLFQPFVQASVGQARTQGGTGLGLVITRRLSQLLGGDVSFKSVPDKGSTFTIQVAARRPDEMEEGDSNRPVVVVIEDEASARDLTRRALSRLPFHVRAAATAAEGLELARTQSPALVVLDIHLPDRSGWDLLEQFKKEPALRDVPVLVVTIDDDRARALDLGACDHLLKPVDRDRLAAAVLLYARIRPLHVEARPARPQIVRSGS